MRLNWIRLPGADANDSSSALEDRGPIRGEGLSLQDLESKARTLAAAFSLARTFKIKKRVFFRRLRQNEEILRRAHDVLAGDVQQAEAIPPAAEWLLDNLQKNGKRHGSRQYPAPSPRRVYPPKRRRTPTLATTWGAEVRERAVATSVA